MASAMAAFYLKIPVCHIEAGVRSGNLTRPFPEEANRRIITLFSSYHFAPTQKSVNQLLSEGIPATSVFWTGNTVVDALNGMKQQLDLHQIIPSEELEQFFLAQQADHKKIFLLTAHRRESFDFGLERIFNAVKQALDQNPDLFFLYPVHPNPAIQVVLDKTQLVACPRIKITKPLIYKDLVYVLNQVDGVLTDSGGIQEEAASLMKPMLILREETDRPEAIDAGLGILVGTNESHICRGIEQILTHRELFHSESMSIYGDGHAAVHI